MGAFYLKIGGIGANVWVEFEKKILSEGIFLKIGGIFKKNWGQWGKCVSGIWKKNFNWGQKIILGSRKSAFLGITLTPVH